MTKELKPCPTCGNKEPNVEFFLLATCQILCRISCAQDFPAVYFECQGIGDTSEGAFRQAAGFWNDRYKRTCKVEDTGFATSRCSACGVEFIASVVNNIPPDCVEPAHFCPNCGAEVVDGD